MSRFARTAASLPCTRMTMRNARQDLSAASDSERGVPKELIPTRWSLIGRLKNWDDQESWREFFDTYWRLIYNVALKAGLTHVEAEEVVQETVVSVSRNIGQFEADPARGSFKNWLLRVTRWRIIDQLRKRASEGPVLMSNSGKRDGGPGSESATATEERILDPAGSALEAVWNAEWENNLVEAALAKLKQQVSGKQFQVFYLHVIKQLPASEVVKTLQVNLGQIYLVKHRVGRVFRELVK